MEAAGIIAEFDPFHNGHRFLISRAREHGATHIAVVQLEVDSEGVYCKRGHILTLWVAENVIGI